MKTFFEALQEFVITADVQFWRSDIVIHLEPDLYERFTFSLKQTTAINNHAKLDEGKLKIATPVGYVLLVRDETVTQQIKEFTNEHTR